MCVLDCCLQVDRLNPYPKQVAFQSCRLLSSPLFSTFSPLLLSPVGGSRNSEHVVIKVEKRGAIVMPSLKSSVAVFHVTNALQSRVVASLLGLFSSPLCNGIRSVHALYLLISFTCGSFASVVLDMITSAEQQKKKKKSLHGCMLGNKKRGTQDLK